MINLIKKPNEWYDQVPEPKRIVILIAFVFFVLMIGGILSDYVSPVFNTVPNIIFVLLFFIRILYNILLRTESKKNPTINKIIQTVCIGDELIAKTDVPDIIEPVGSGFFKNKKYLIVDISGQSIDVKGEYEQIDTFSIDEKYKGVNYLWDWFDKV